MAAMKIFAKINLLKMKKQTSATTETRFKIKQLVDFFGKILYVGIDVHKINWQVAVFYEGLILSNCSMAGSIENLLAYLQRHYPQATLRCVYESSAWGFTLCRKLTAAGISCIVVHAADVPGSHKERTNKTDKVDAAMLARLHAGGLLKAIHVPDKTLQKQRSLIRLRKGVVSDLQRTRNRIKSHLKFFGIEIPKIFEKSNWSKLFINWLEKMASEEEDETLAEMIVYMKTQRQTLLRVEKSIRKLTISHFEEKEKRIRTVPGIGRVTAMQLLLELGDIKRFKTFDDLNGFVGFYPGSYSSGETSRDTGLTNRRHTQLRTALIESAWTAVRIDPAMLEAFVKLKRRMETNKAIIRIARKLLRRIRLVMLTDQNYEKGIVEQKAAPKAKQKPEVSFSSHEDAD